jgi:hypothetical protein
MLQVVFRFFGPCLGVRYRARPEAAQSPRIACGAPTARTSLWSRLLRTLFFWRGRRAETVRACRQPLPRITYVSTPPPLSDQDTAKSIAERLAPLPPEALGAFCARCSKDTLQAMVDWCHNPGNDPAAGDAAATAAAKAMIEATAREALRRFEPNGIVPRAGVGHVSTQLHRELAKVRDGKGVLDLARLRDDWVSPRPRDRKYLDGGQHAAGTFDMFRRSVEALCRFEMADGEPALTQALAAQLAEAAQALCKALETGGLTVTDMTVVADALRLLERDTALALIRTHLGIAQEAPPSRPSNAATPDEAAEASSGRIGEKPRSSPPPAAVKTLTDLLLDARSDADQIGAAIDSLVHNLRTLARQRAGEGALPEIERRVDDLLARAGARLTEPQLHRLGDALQRLDLKAWGTCRKLLDIRQALYDAGKQALRDAMAGIAGVRAQQSAARAQAQQIWQSVGLVDAEVAGGAGPSGGRPRDGAEPRSVSTGPV